MGKYDDIIDLPHHVSATRHRMSMTDRAAQFSPFAALVGYGDAVVETARLTDRRIELDENRIEEIDEQLMKLQNAIENGEHPCVQVTRFVADERKDGGAYVTLEGTVKRLEPLGRCIVMTDGSTIPLEDVFNIDMQ